MGLDFGKWIQEAGVNIGNDVIGRVSEELGGPQLPPLTVVEPFTNSNAYVGERGAPDSPANLFTDGSVNSNRKLMLYGGAAVALFVVVALLMRRK